MIILAVIVGYLLGIAPFIAPKVMDRIDNIKKAEIEDEKTKEQEEIFDEWLNGVNEPKEINQHDLFEEYITGKVKGA